MPIKYAPINGEKIGTRYEIVYIPLQPGEPFREKWYVRVAGTEAFYISAFLFRIDAQAAVYGYNRVDRKRVQAGKAPRVRKQKRNLVLPQRPIIRY